MNLEDRFYTSTEVAEILGVSLRSVYRYLEEDKLIADVKTATGRHRFTKNNILNFLYPQGQIPKEKEEDVSILEKKKPAEKEEPKKDEKKDEVDWLSKFREAAEKHRTRVSEEEKVQEKPVQKETEVKKEEPKEEPAPAPEPQKETLSSLAAPEPQPEKQSDTSKTYYKSNIGGLKELAQYINKTAQKSSVPYAFTMNSGLSLHKLIRPFSVLHIYVRNEDKEFFEKALELTPSDQNNAQICIYLGPQKVIDERKEIHGLFVVSDLQLRQDLLDSGEVDLAGELDEALNI